MDGRLVALAPRDQCGRELLKLYLAANNKVFFLRTFKAKSVLCLFRALKQRQDSLPQPDAHCFSIFYREIAQADLLYPLSLRLDLFDRLTAKEAADLCQPLVDGDRLGLFHLINQSADSTFCTKKNRLQKLFGALGEYGCRNVFAMLDPANRKIWCEALDDPSICQLWRWLKAPAYRTASSLSSVSPRQFFPVYDARSWPPATLQDFVDAIPKEKILALDLTMC
jgi:hypothetical protein